MRGSLPTIGRRQAFAYVAGIGLATVWPTAAQKATASQGLLSLPMAGPSSPDTWWLDQWYGNTAFAYRAPNSFYREGQGLHFGIDFGMVCGTRVVAAADGIVREVGGPLRAWPLHIAIDHRDLGVTTVYGHLSQSLVTNVGQMVKRGEVIAESGDSESFACDCSPHLHFEVRYDHMRSATNPVPWIPTDWPAVYSPDESSSFVIDLENPSRWQSIYDQPDVRFGWAHLNEYERAWVPE